MPLTCLCDFSERVEGEEMEGMLIRKHQWESTTKKASNRYKPLLWLSIRTRADHLDVSDLGTKCVWSSKPTRLVSTRTRRPTEPAPKRRIAASRPLTSRAAPRRSRQTTPKRRMSSDYGEFHLLSAVTFFVKTLIMCVWLDNLKVIYLPRKVV